MQNENNRFIFTSVLVLIFLTSSLYNAQTVTGKVLDNTTKNPLSDVIVMLLDKNQQVIGFGSTDNNGIFSFNDVVQDTFRLKLQRMDYSEKITQKLCTKENSTELSFELIPADLILGEVEVIDKKTVAFLKEFGFYERLANYSGTFLTPTEIKKMHPGGHIKGFITKVPGLKFNEVDKSLYLAKNESMGIPANVYVDGILIQSGGGNGMIRGPRSNRQPGMVGDYDTNPLDSLNPLEIVAIEIYKTSAEAPVKYALRAGGVILIWTGRAN